jgi:hypothetical protein
MEVKPPPDPDVRREREDVATEYRVVLWEQPEMVDIDPEMADIDPEMIGWGEITWDLVGAQDVNEVLEWAKRQLEANEGAYSRGGTPVRDREYVVYARVPGEDRYLQVAGWDPSRNPAGDNLRRVEGHS